MSVRIWNARKNTVQSVLLQTKRNKVLLCFVAGIHKTKPNRGIVLSFSQCSSTDIL